MKKLKHSEYIENIHAAGRALVGAALLEFEYASLLSVDSSGKNYRVQNAGVSVSDEPLYCSRGHVLRFVRDGRIYEYSFSSLCMEDIPSILSRAREICDKNTYTEDLGERADVSFTLKEEACALSESTEYELDPEEYGDERIIKRLSDIRASAFELDSRIFDVICRTAYRKYTKLFISREKDMIQSVMWTTAAILSLCREGEKIKDSYRGYSNLGGVEIIDKMEREGVSLTVRAATELLSAEQIAPGEYECICSPDVTGMIVHEAFGHGVEMDMFVRDRAKAKEYVGKRVASDLVTMHDTAAAAKEAATFFFDDEGNLSRDTVVIKEGILVGGMSDAAASEVLGREPSGNGRRESFERKAYTRMTNTYFEGGHDKVEDMIASVSYGFLLEEARSGMEDPKNWGIQCMVGIAREIKDGALTGKIFSPIVLTGYVPDLLQSISMASEEVELFGCGFCGKGHKEWVKVSDGGPYIKAKITLG